VGWANVKATPIEIATVFADFDDYWTPFLGKTGAAPAYLATHSQSRCGRRYEAAWWRGFNAAPMTGRSR